LGSLGSKFSVSKFLVQIYLLGLLNENNHINDAVKDLLLESPQAVINSTSKLLVQDVNVRLLLSDKSLTNLLKENTEEFDDPTLFIKDEKVGKVEVSKEVFFFIYYLVLMIFYILVVDMKIEDKNGRSFEDFLVNETDNDGPREQSNDAQNASKSKDKSGALENQKSEIDIYNVMARSFLAVGLTSVLLKIAQKKA